MLLGVGWVSDSVIRHNRCVGLRPAPNPTYASVLSLVKLIASNTLNFIND